METVLGQTVEVRGYVVAIIAVTAAVLARLALSGMLGDKAPFFTFVVATLVAASYGGLYPGLLASILGAILGTFLFLAPLHSFRIEHSGDIVIVGLYLLVAGTTSGSAVHCTLLGAALRQNKSNWKALSNSPVRL